MNNTTNEPQKTAVIKTLAIIGFIVGIILVAWLAVQAVRLIPSTFRTLASIADSLDHTRRGDFSIASEKGTVESGEETSFSWTPLATRGTYTFSYQCVDGISVRIEDAVGGMSALSCETEAIIETDSNSLKVAFTSEKNRFTDVLYTIAFIADDAQDESYERTGIITVSNPAVNNGTATPNTGGTDETPVTPKPTTPTTQKPTTPTTVITVPVVTTSYPVSNPNGYVDLAVTFIGVGEYRNGRFVKQSELEEGERGALQFEVRNIGTKTSGAWNYRAELPTESEDNYVSAMQSGLRPNERQIITLQFDNVSDSSSERATATVYASDDFKTANNSFSQTIRIDK